MPDIILLLVLLGGALFALSFGTRAGMRLYRQTHKLFASLSWGMSVGVLWVMGTYLLLLFYFLFTFK